MRGAQRATRLDVICRAIGWDRTHTRLASAVSQRLQHLATHTQEDKEMTAKQRKREHRDWLKYFGWDTDSSCLVFMDTGEPVGSLDLGAAVWIAQQREAERHRPADSVPDDWSQF